MITYFVFDVEKKENRPFQVRTDEGYQLVCNEVMHQFGKYMNYCACGKHRVEQPTIVRGYK